MNKIVLLALVASVFANNATADKLPSLTTGMQLAMDGRAVRDPLLMAAALRILLYNGMGHHTITSWLREELETMPKGREASQIETVAESAPWKGRVGGYFDDVMTVSAAAPVHLTENFDGSAWGFVAIYARESEQMNGMSVSVRTLDGDVVCWNADQPQMCRWSVQTNSRYEIKVTSKSYTPVTFSLVIE